MRREFTIALIALLPVPLAAAQQPTPPLDTTAPAQANEAPDSRSGLSKVGGRISPPEILRSVNAEFSDEARRAKYQGVCLIGLIVDAEGNPQNIHVVRALGMGLDEKAIEAIRQYKFKPAMKDGTTPVPTMITIEVDFRLYSGKKPSHISPVPIGAPRFDPVPGNAGSLLLINYVEPRYSHFGRKNRISGECVIGLTVDIHGMPQNVHVVTSLDPSLDQNAIEAVKKWRYTPPMINGNAAPIDGTVKVNFTFPE
jgi:TonB family protein